MLEYTEDYLFNLKVKIFQPVSGYRASTDAVMLSAMPDKVKSGDRILDVGSGTGAISLCLAHRLQQQNVRIYGFELQCDLAELSTLSAKENGFDDFLTYHNVDVRTKVIPEKANSFQHVITNPPYSEADMQSPNESKSLAHNFVDFNLDNWIQFCLKMLVPQGRLYMVNRAEALPQILVSLYGKAGEINIIPLCSKQNQNAKRVLVSARKGSRAPAVIRPSLTVHQDDGTYTYEAEQILRWGKCLAEL